MMYTIPWNPLTNAPSTTNIIRDADGANIPNDPGNTDYVAYLAWVADGNTATTASAPPPDASTAIADSANALALSQAKSLATQGRTSDAIAAVLKLLGA